MNYKNLLTPFLALLTLAPNLASAEVVNVDVYQKNFTIPNSARFISLRNAKVVNAVKKYESVPNPRFSYDSGEYEFLETPLETVRALKLVIGYEHEDYGGIEKGEVTAYVPLATFSEEQLAVLTQRGHGWKRLKLVESVIKFEVREFKETTTMPVCSDLGFDSYNGDFSQCVHVVNIPVQNSEQILSISKK